MLGKLPCRSDVYVEIGFRGRALTKCERENVQNSRDPDARTKVNNRRVRKGRGPRLIIRVLTCRKNNK